MATLNLERSDLLQLDPISAKGTLKLLPLGKKNKVSVVINCVLRASGLLSMPGLYSKSC